jgi:hypothetical protein
MGSAVGVALLIDSAIHFTGKSTRGWVAWGFSFAVALLIAWQGAAIAQNATDFDGEVRQVRLQFRPIFQSAASFAPDTFLYFINAPVESPYLSGMFFLRYGANVTVSGTDYGHAAGLRDHNAAYVAYHDGAQNWHLQRVEKDDAPNILPSTPASFGQEISLDSVELVSTHVKRGETLVLLLYWRAVKRIERDYTVFVHLVDRSGTMATGYDTLLLLGAAPTSRWQLNETMACGVAIPIDETVMPGAFSLELGLYDSATMERLTVIDSNGRPIADKVVLDPIRIDE